MQVEEQKDPRRTSACDLSALHRIQGLYILVMKLDINTILSAGKRPSTLFPEGTYLYAGSAGKGLKNRIQRHLRKDKVLFWHIDYFLQHSRIHQVWVKLEPDDECALFSRIKEALLSYSVPSRKLGSSDCTCSSHLIQTAHDAGALMKILSSLGLRKVNIHE